MKINENIKYIKKNENFYIGKNNKLLPEYCHIIVFQRQNKNLMKISLMKQEKIKIQENNIENCNKEIDKYNSDIDKIKNAIWNNGVFGLKLNEIVNIEK